MWHTIQFFFSTFNDIHLSFIIFQIEWFMQQKEKSFQLLSPRFNDLLFEEQWYLVSYSLFCLFSALVKKVRYFIDVLQLELAIIWLTKMKQTVHVLILSPTPHPLLQSFILQVLWVLQATYKVEEVGMPIQGYSWELSSGS